MEEEKTYTPFRLGLLISSDRELSLTCIESRSCFIGSGNKMVQECCFLITAEWRWSGPGFFLCTPLLRIHVECRSELQFYPTCFEVQVHLGRILVSVLKVPTKVTLVQIRSQSLWGEWAVLIGLGQSGAILGIGSGVNSAQIHGLKVEFGCAQGNLEYECWLAESTGVSHRHKWPLPFCFHPCSKLVLYIRYFWGHLKCFSFGDCLICRLVVNVYVCVCACVCM